MNPRLLVPRANFDADAAAYIRAVEIADAQALEGGVKRAIDQFVRGCKKDGIWDAIKASCILAGARTLAGALVPLKGAAPTNNNFVSGDYNRETGLVGDGSTKFLDSNRNANADPQNSHHMSVHVHTAPPSIPVGAPNSFPVYIGTGGADANASTIGRLNSNSASFYLRHRSSAFDSLSGVNSLGFVGLSRSASSGYTFRVSGADNTVTRASGASMNGNIGVYRAGAAETATSHGAGRYNFYSIGESISLASLEARVSALITNIGNAI
jgi:hypothetical protein